MFKRRLASTRSARRAACTPKKALRWGDKASPDSQQISQGDTPGEERTCEFPSFWWCTSALPQISAKHRAGESEIWPTNAPTKGLPQVLTRVLTQVYTRVPTKIGFLCVIIPYEGSHFECSKWFGRMSPGLFSPALFLTQNSSQSYAAQWQFMQTLVVDSQNPLLP